MSAKPADPRLIIRQAVRVSIVIVSGFVTRHELSVSYRQRIIDASKTACELWTRVCQTCRRRSLIHVFDDDFHRFLCRGMDSELMSQTPVRWITAFK